MPIRVITRRADEITGFGEARLWSETTRIDLHVRRDNLDESRIASPELFPKIASLHH